MRPVKPLAGDMISMHPPTPPLSHQCPPVIKTTICFLKALLNVRLTQFVRKCSTISFPPMVLKSGQGSKTQQREGGICFVAFCFLSPAYSNEGDLMAPSR